MIPLRPDERSFLDEVLLGLDQEPKRLPPKLLYDREGSELFERICETREYYPTRTEVSILETWGSEIARSIGPKAAVIELGSGSALKTRLLLKHLREPAVYIPIDISPSALGAGAASLARIFPGLRIAPIQADFTRRLELDPSLFEGAGTHAVFFPGSTIGNFDPEDAVDLLSKATALAGPEGALLIGTDLVKDRSTLEAAYNDSDEVTAAFNRNLLRRMRRELHAEVDLDAFEHQAFFNESSSRIEMHLRSLKSQTIRIGSKTFRLRAGETIHTENSYKYTDDSFARLAGRAGLRVRRTWRDSQRLFAFHWLSRLD